MIPLFYQQWVQKPWSCLRACWSSSVPAPFGRRGWERTSVRPLELWHRNSPHRCQRQNTDFSQRRASIYPTDTKWWHLNKICINEKLACARHTPGAGRWCRCQTQAAGAWSQTRWSPWLWERPSSDPPGAAGSNSAWRWSSQPGRGARRSPWSLRGPWKHTFKQRRKYSRAEGKTAPKKCNVAPDVTRRGTTNNNLDNLIAFCSLLCVSYLYCLHSVGTH